MENQELFKHLIGKGRISAWLILVSIVLLCMAGRVSGDQALEVIKWLGGLVIVGEAAARRD